MCTEFSLDDAMGMTLWLSSAFHCFFATIFRSLLSHNLFLNLSSHRGHWIFFIYPSFFYWLLPVGASGWEEKVFFFFPSFCPVFCANSSCWNGLKNYSAAGNDLAVNPDGSAVNPAALQQQLRQDSNMMAQLFQVEFLSMSLGAFWCIHLGISCLIYGTLVEENSQSNGCCLSKLLWMIWCWLGYLCCTLCFSSDNFCPAPLWCGTEIKTQATKNFHNNKSRKQI